MAARDYANNSMIKNNQAMQSVDALSPCHLGIHEEAGPVAVDPGRRSGSSGRHGEGHRRRNQPAGRVGAVERGQE